jgi:hypothetical protein
LLVTNGQAYLKKTLQGSSGLSTAHIEVDVETTCLDEEHYYWFASLSCEDETGHAGSVVLDVSSGKLAYSTDAPRSDAGQSLIDGGGLGNGFVSKLPFTRSWQHLAADFTPLYGVTATLGPSPDGGSMPAFANNPFGYGCPHPTEWTVTLGIIYASGPSCDVHFDNFLVSYTKDGGSG